MRGSAVDDDLRHVVPSAKFIAEFPDGHVPITHTEHLFWADDNYDDAARALEDTATIYDEARRRLGKIDPVAVDLLVKEYHQNCADGNANSEWTFEIIRRLVQSGLRVGPILRIVERWQFDQAYRGLSALTVDQIIAFDDDILRGESYYTAAKRAGVSTLTGRIWSTARGFDHETPLNEAAALWEGAGNKAKLLADVQERYPYTHLDRTTTYRRYKENHG